jgi:hypothetical protein
LRFLHAADALGHAGGNQDKKGSSTANNAAINMKRPELPRRANTEVVENMKAASTPI